MKTIVVYENGGTTGKRRITQVTKASDPEATKAALMKAGKAFFEFDGELPGPVRDIAVSIEFVERDRTPEELKAPLYAELGRLAAAVELQPIEMNGHIFDGDARSFAIANAFAQGIALGDRNPHGGYWRLADNSEIPFTDEDVTALAKAFRDRRFSIERRRRSVKALIASADYIDEFDLASEWDKAAEA